jgi:hypothetical protein
MKQNFLSSNIEQAFNVQTMRSLPEGFLVKSADNSTW